MSGSARKVLIALGDCAVFGGVPTMRNTCGIQEALQRAYVETESTVDGQIPQHEDIAVMQDARALDQVVPVDIYLPGCPPSADAIFYVADRAAGRPHAGAEGQEPGLALSPDRFKESTVWDRKIMIEPVTRIEGHAKVTVHLDDQRQGRESASSTSTSSAASRSSAKGRMFFEMPQITPRICGICPVSHHLASAKACDADHRRRRRRGRPACCAS